ncbi:hypothetical protein EAF04_007567 [Stromatinia cepivora]|nr:hypothetical protein EAF04_007567 [Stromatinia cepivora]
MNKQPELSTQKQKLRQIISEKTWIGFDLDDTLHSFRHSSNMASTKVLEEISLQFSIHISELKETYTYILKQKTINAFSDGKTSFGYRRERFIAVLAHFSLPQEIKFVGLLDLYEETLMRSLELKCGVVELLSILREMGKKIVVITEGPQDAQERTLKGLGISGFVDFLATTNYFGVSKIDGLFSKVLGFLDVKSDDMVYIGDSEVRDMKPAMAEGIFSIHFSEMEDGCLDLCPLKINRWRELRDVLFDADGN